MRSKFIKAAALLMLATIGTSTLAQPPAGGPPAGGAARSPLVPLLIESKAFEDGGIVPLKYSFYGTNTLPDFKISNIPPTAKSIAVILHDLDVAAGGNPDDNLHWLAWNIPATPPMIQTEEGKLPDGAVNGRGRGYMGMGAPNGPRYHHYVFEFYALNAMLDLPATPGGRAELLEAMKGKVVAKAAYVGRFRNDTNAPRPANAVGPGGPAPARP
ncbi:MAG TPA: YbhB/YbcL family Raf kinase inhibitor-like protein [Candidatus Acidoferrum sp.]|nr:YbhB/YbcL family Raf kinase inhibitor-like protein [Candidatus Acidoferrum sp.]